MSALNYLLGPRGATPEPDNDVDAPRTLLAQGEVRVHLQEDLAREEVVIFSVPGSLSAAAWLAERTAPWKHVSPHPAHPEARAILAVDPASCEVLLIEAWPRAALDHPTFATALETHLLAHLTWQAALRTELQD